MIGGVAATAAVRTWPFRVYSFPSEIVPQQFEFSEFLCGAFPVLFGGNTSSNEITWLSMEELNHLLERFRSNLDAALEGDGSGTLWCAEPFTDGMT
jgi:hypothetical protein